ncbi:LacI family DNA-binding transcriptional regulator [Parapedobacter indicus]|uniref:Transcriptional regulator, LacI family n=1 Tax=Parapedobacter indicus TaxID=1477437 RepID=A0A1I3D0A3_9SPHI|nr:LacI family DNA-binding transcriptional regulator [Parapedobacter indicus]PPL04473.1 LacI family transcriptional regulator [Parapedobacter indicus]SFH80147.1 transcriptional regulator, LacI family [Parapedobacter indicus]
MKEGKPATIKEIAKRLKISPSTVSRALNDHPSIGLVTTMRVKKVAAELNYEPNQTAIFFKQRKTFTVGVVLPNLSEPFFSAAISEIENVANGKNYTVIMGQSMDDADREMKILQTLKNHRVDGVLMSIGKNTRDYPFIDLMEGAGIPIVFFDCVPDLEHIHKVYCDLETGMLEAIDRFVSCGHHAISLINGPTHLPASLEREKAYRKGLAQYNIRYKEEYVVNTDLTPEGNEAAISQLLALPDRPSAVVSFNDYVALDVMKIVRKRGIALNQDIHFISYANYPLWTYIENPPLASIEQFPGEQGGKAAELLFQLIEANGRPEPTRITFHSRLVNPG